MPVGTERRACRNGEKRREGKGEEEENPATAAIARARSQRPLWFFLLCCCFISLGVVCLSILGVVQFLIWFPYKPDHFPSS
jgi:hypothetical protein